MCGGSHIYASKTAAVRIASLATRKSYRNHLDFFFSRGIPDTVLHNVIR